MIAHGLLTSALLAIAQLAPPADQAGGGNPATPVAKQAPAPLGPTLADEPDPQPPAESSTESSPKGSAEPSPDPAADAAPAEASAPSAASANPAPNRLEPQAAEPLVPADRNKRRALPEVLPDALAAATVSGLQGRPISLNDALAAAANPLGKAELIRAYWRLACGMLEYGFGRAEVRLLERAAQAGRLEETAAADLKRAQDEAAARRAAAQTAVSDAQRGLAVLLRAPLNAEALLASDAPHAGPYHTRFDQVFAGRAAPAQLWLLDRLLPLRHEEIEARGRAMFAAEDAVTTSEDALRAGQGQLGALLYDLSLFTSVRRTLVAALEQYNDEIADYATAISAGANDPLLASMLIKPRGAAGLAPPRTIRSDQVEQAGFEEQRPAEGITAEDEETLADLMADTQVYQGLTSLEPNKQTQRLINTLYWRSEGSANTASLGLVELLQATAAVSSQREQLIAAYWRAREFATRRHLLDEAVVQLESLTPLALAAGSQPGGAGQLLVLRATQSAARADLLATQIAELTESWRLTVALGRPLDQPWLNPISTPHAGRYRTRVDELSPTPALRQMAAEIDQLHEKLVAESAAVIESDETRSAATADYAKTRGDVRDVLGAVASELNASLTLLADVTRYNDTIARYALGVLPAGSPASLAASTMISAPATSASKP